MTQTFEGPTYNIPFAPPFSQWHTTKGKTVYRLDDEWVETTHPLWTTLTEADVVAATDRPGGEKIDGSERFVFLGGRVYEVSDAVATALSDAGYSDYLT